jgi:hypothetical protein
MTTVYMKHIDNEYGDIIDLELYHFACAPMEADAYPAYESDDCRYCDECNERLVMGYDCDCDVCEPYVCSLPAPTLT